MNMEQMILDRLLQLDDWRWDGLLGEREYQERAAIWRRALVEARNNRRPGIEAEG